MENQPAFNRMKKSRSTEPSVFTLGKERELMIFRLKLWNRSDCDLFDLVLRVYDADTNELVTAYPLGVNFKSRRERKDAEIFTPFKNESVLPGYVKKIRFSVEPIKATALPGFKTDFEVKFDLF
jgi:hypothetical protein